MNNTEKRRRIAELDNEQEIGKFISIDEVRKLQRVNSAIRYMQNIWGGDHDTYTKILVDYIEELEAKLERSSNQDT